MEYPRIWQAPTGSIAGPELCAAVVRAGGVGAMGLTWTDPWTTREYVSKVRAKSSGIFLVNYALAFEPAGLAAALEAGAPMISFSWGDPSPYLDLVRSFGAKLGVQVVSGESACRALDLGADVLICQGIEAGGHVESSTPLADLLPEVVAAAQNVPVVAAGGLAVRDDADAMIALGAASAMFGTRFVASDESRAHPLYKQLLVDSAATELTTCFREGWPDAPHRVLPNKTLRDWNDAGRPEQNRPGDGDVLGRWGDRGWVCRYSDAAPQINTSGRIEEMCLYAGTGCSRIESILPAGEIVRMLAGIE